MSRSTFLLLAFLYWAGPVLVSGFALHAGPASQGPETDGPIHWRWASFGAPAETDAASSTVRSGTLTFPFSSPWELAGQRLYSHSELDSLCACFRVNVKDPNFTGFREIDARAETGENDDYVRRREQWLSSLLSAWSLPGSGLSNSVFTDAQWVRERDIKNLSNYARSQNRWDPNVDGSGIRNLDIEYLYQVYLKGSAAPLLDQSEGWGAIILGGVIEQVDGLVGFWRSFQGAVFSNNLFRPSNPLRRFRGKSSPKSPPRPGGSGGSGYARGLDQAAWSWRGDLSVDVAPNLGRFNVDRVVLEVGRLKLFRDFEIDFDLFYKDAGE